MSTEVASRRIWPVPAAVVTGLLIFAVTFYSYAEGRRTQQEGGYLPLILVGGVSPAFYRIFKNPGGSGRAAMEHRARRWNTTLGLVRMPVLPPWPDFPWAPARQPLNSARHG